MPITQSKISWFKYMSLFDKKNLLSSKRESTLLYTFPKGEGLFIDILYTKGSISKKIPYVVLARRGKDYQEFFVEKIDKAYYLVISSISEVDTQVLPLKLDLGSNIDMANLSNLVEKIAKKG